MYWDHLIGHDDLKRALERALSNPAPGYLFYGPSGIGKTAIAYGFARALLEHPAEKSLDIHPDFLELRREPTDKHIGVESVRELVDQMYLSPALGRCRIALIQDADALNTSASNCLLKAVEEPKANNVYLFTAISHDRIPQTLRSRLVNLRMRPRASDDLATWLCSQGVNETKAKEAAMLAGGCPGRAKRMAEEHELWKNRKELVEALLAGCADKTGARLEALQRLKKSMEKEEDPTEAWRACLQLAMRLARERLSNPKRFAEVAEGLTQAWHYVGSPVSPEVALEWTAVRSSFINKGRYTPHFLYPTYL